MLTLENLFYSHVSVIEFLGNPEENLSFNCLTVNLKAHLYLIIFSLDRDVTYVARVRFGIRVRVRVRVRVRDSAIFEKGGCGCGGTRRLKNY